MTMALRPCPTSIYKNPGVSKMPPSAQRLFGSDRCILYVWFFFLPEKDV